ncbi:MAG: phospholipase D-like domain-containing protein [Nanoarchaeota archaeon]|nr:phospholipase D-like domain-containing protein [Nanoarchaeota archaeon]
MRNELKKGLKKEVNRQVRRKKRNIMRRHPLLSILVLLFLIGLLFIERFEIIDTQDYFDKVQERSSTQQSSSNSTINSNENSNENLDRDAYFRQQFEEKIQEIPQREVIVEEFEFVFCNQEGFPCLDSWVEYFDMAQESIECAIQDLNEEYLVNMLLEKYSQGVEISIIYEEDYSHRPFVEEFRSTSIELIDDSLRNARFQNLMHHKFCVVDRKHSLLGTANPTRFGLQRNDNVIFIVKNNDVLAQELILEFEEMRDAKFGANKEGIEFYNTRYLLQKDDMIIGDFQLYFCPHQRCEDKLIETLNLAQNSIQFATYVLTLDSVENLLLDKLEEGVEIIGLVDRRLINAQGSIISQLQHNFSIKREMTTATMHHKTFIVDSQYVIFGSMNPTRSGVYFNDENMIVVNSSYVAQLFEDEFERIERRSEYFRE